MTQSIQQDKGARAQKADRKRLRDRTVAITLTLPQAIFGTLFSLFALVWVFIFGIMLGRGHNPEDVVPELARVMPAPGQSGVSSAPAPFSGEPPRDDADEVLQSRDLQYHDSLKAKDAQKKSPAIAPPPPAPPPAVRPRPQPDVKPPSGSGDAASQTASPDEIVYTYVYQVAAFNNASGAESMRKKLQEGGLTAKVDKRPSNGTTWYRIMVSFRGKPEDTRALRERLAAYGINAIILRGKSPVK